MKQKLNKIFLLQKYHQKGNGEYSVKNNVKESVLYICQNCQMYLSQMKYFLESIKNQRFSMENILEAVKTLEIILDIKSTRERIA